MMIKRFLLLLGVYFFLSVQFIVASDSAVSLENEKAELRKAFGSSDGSEINSGLEANKIPDDKTAGEASNTISDQANDITTTGSDGAPSGLAGKSPIKINTMNGKETQSDEQNTLPSSPEFSHSPESNSGIVPSPTSSGWVDKGITSKDAPQNFPVDRVNKRNVPLRPGEVVEDQGVTLEDAYYGLDQTVADNLDRVVFQPSHVLSISVEPGAIEVFHEDIKEIDVGVVLRCSWFVTSGEVLEMHVLLHDPNDVILYDNDPTNTEIETSRHISDGSFKIRATIPGRYRLIFTNPGSDTRTLSFGWLVGRDDDDSYMKKYFDKAGEEDAEGRLSDVAADIMHRVSSLHKDIDDLISMQKYADVRFSRHSSTIESIQRRLARWSLVETFVVIASVVLQQIIVRRFRFKGLKHGRFV